MHQLLLHGFPEGAIRIGNLVSCLCKENKVTWFIGYDNVFDHLESDHESRRYIVATLIRNGHARAVDFENSELGIPHRTLMNWCLLLEAEGSSGFFKRRTVRGSAVLTGNKIRECEHLLWQGNTIASVARLTGISDSTLRKGVSSGRIQRTPPEVVLRPSSLEGVASTKSERIQQDAVASCGMGTACTRADERMMSAVGLVNSATTRFEHTIDVARGGLLCGLPALCANGLFSGLDRHLNGFPKGFYSAMHILTLLGYMALARIKRPEGLRHIPPGEMGKVMGLDRSPEVNTLRKKIHLMARNSEPLEWMKELSQSWMNQDPEAAGYLYVDGHVRVYHGSKAALPKRYVARQKLCARGTTDYWVNDVVGRPFFVVSKALNEGLCEAILTDIMPELIKSVPRQPSDEQLNRDSSLHRFIVLFDREGYSIPFLEKLWENRIGAITYCKYVKDKWDLELFKKTEVSDPWGNTTEMMIASKIRTLTSKDSKVIVREVRRLTKTGHQTAIITTALTLDPALIAGRMFARWCQENFFKYMMEHFDIDGLTEYGIQDIPSTFKVVNPEWSILDKERKVAQKKLRNMKAKLGKETLENNSISMKKHAEIIEEIELSIAEHEQIKKKLKKVPRKIEIKHLPENQRPQQLKPLTKALTDTVKMIAYRAETALVEMVKKHLAKPEEARAIIRELFVTDADLKPCEKENTLTVKVHRMAVPANDKAIEKILSELTEMEFKHPENGMKIVYQMV